MRILITGGAGFIGSNAARRFRELGHDVVVFDSFVRAASRFNRAWLEKLHPEVRFIEGDVRSSEALRDALDSSFDVVLHLAGQVAVTTSIVDPVTDYEINALGTFQLLEELRPDRPAAAEVGVVGRDVGQPVRRPVGHQDHRRSGHAATATGASRTSAASRVSTS